MIVEMPEVLARAVQAAAFAFTDAWPREELSDEPTDLQIDAMAVLVIVAVAYERAVKAALN